jgi:hypothetical protein
MVPMDWLVQAMVGAEPGAVEIAESEIQTRTRPSQGDPANDWLCAWCLNRVASEKDRFCYDGKSEFSFKNPEGIRFDIFTFSRTIGCRQVGVPTLAHTWFPGHRGPTACATAAACIWAGTTPARASLPD